MANVKMDPHASHNRTRSVHFSRDSHNIPNSWAFSTLHLEVSNPSRSSLTKSPGFTYDLQLIFWCPERAIVV
jgi:hypothetical protein